MRIFGYILYKDLLLIIKDRAGATIMFLMPLILVFIMTTIQDGTFKAVYEARTDLVLLNNDKDTLGNTIGRELRKLNLFEICQDFDNEEAVKEAVRKGKYQIGLIVPEGAYKKIKMNIKRMVAGSFTGNNRPEGNNDTTLITIYIDPATKSSYRALMLSSMHEFAAKIEKKILVTEIIEEINKRLPAQKIHFDLADMITFREEYAVSGKNTHIPNSVQHNVPAWTLFAMFFIVISLSGNMVRERLDRSYYRLMIIPHNIIYQIVSKIVVYFVICLIQLALMLLMGVWLLPLFGLESLAIGSGLSALIMVGTTAALAAIGYSILIGTIATSFHQAATFGSVSVVILAAIGGIWVPAFAMPWFMRQISVLSPLNWGINGFYEVFVRDGNLKEVLPYSALLFVFFLLCTTVSIVYEYIKKNRA
ncbi:MAG: ABC transporter permease [Bacteroidetes bacterium]|nr:ABC transporter permease [Bacteroidota bacterium]